MSGLFRRLSSRRSEGPESTEPSATAESGALDSPARTPAEAEGQRSLLADPAAEAPIAGHGVPAPAADPSAGHTPAPAIAPSEDQAAPAPAPDPSTGQAAPAPAADPGVLAAAEVGADLPAGLDPDELAATAATSARRGKLRRRAAFLRAAREVLLRDLGGFVYELHRTARDVEHEAHRRLRETKLARLERVDAELHAIELRLDDVRRQVLVREPGIGGECPHCGELYGSAAHYCSRCGNPLTDAARRELAKAQQTAAPVAPVAISDQPTQELPPPDTDPTAEFVWPTREADATPGSGAAASAAAAAASDPAASGGASGAAGASDAAEASDTASGDASDPATTSDAAEASGRPEVSDATASDTAESSDATAGGAAGGGASDPAAASGPAEAGDATASGPAEVDDATASGPAEADDATASGAAEAGAPAEGDDASGATTAGGEADERIAPRGDADVSADAPADEHEARGARNGHDALRPVERRR